MRIRGSMLAGLGTVLAGVVLTGTVLVAFDAEAAWAADVPALPAHSCQPGETPINPVSASRTRHNGVSYTFRINGQTATEVVPPAGFQPTRASGAELAEMHLPARPAGTDPGFADWQAKMTSFRGVAAPLFCQGRPGLRFSHSYTTNWGGYVDTSAHYAKVISHWTQPHIGSCGCTGTPYGGIWVGLGGSNTTSLVQAGTDTGGRAWYEDLGTAKVNPPVFNGTVAAGDDVTAAVNWNTAKTQATFGVVDHSVYLINVTLTLDSTYYDDSTADFIVEKVSGDPLANYGQVNFGGARVTLVGSSTVYNFTQQPYNALITISGGSTGPVPPCSTSTVMLQYPENASVQAFDMRYCRPS